MHKITCARFHCLCFIQHQKSRLFLTKHMRADSCFMFDLFLGKCHKNIKKPWNSSYVLDHSIFLRIFTSCHSPSFYSYTLSIVSLLFLCLSRASLSGISNVCLFCSHFFFVFSSERKIRAFLERERIQSYRSLLDLNEEIISSFSF